MQQRCADFFKTPMFSFNKKRGSFDLKIHILIKLICILYLKKSNFCIRIKGQRVMNAVLIKRAY